MRTPDTPAENLLIVDLELPRDRYPDRAAVAGFFREASDRIGRLPGVVAVGGITDFFIRRNADQWVTIEGRAAGTDEGAPRLAIEGRHAGIFPRGGHRPARRPRLRRTGLSSPARPASSSSAKPWRAGSGPARARSASAWSVASRRRRTGAGARSSGSSRTCAAKASTSRPILGAFIPAFPRSMDMTIRASTGVENLIPAVRREIRAIDSVARRSDRRRRADGQLSERLDARRFESQALGAVLRDRAAACRRPASMRSLALSGHAADARDRHSLGARRRSPDDRER